MKSRDRGTWKRRISQFVIIPAALLALATAGCSSLRTVPQTDCYKRGGLDPRIEAVIDEFRPSVIEVMKDTKMVGAAIALVDTDGIIWTEGFGYTDRKRRTPVTPDTPFLINCMDYFQSVSSQTNGNELFFFRHKPRAHAKAQRRVNNGASTHG